VNEGTRRLGHVGQAPRTADEGRNAVREDRSTTKKKDRGERNTITEDPWPLVTARSLAGRQVNGGEHFLPGT